MTNGINATQADIFLFLTKRNNWQTEAAAIHTNDGIITLNEFDIYITKNWESNEMGCATPEDDIIKKFWNQFDVNTEGLFAGNHQVQNKYALDQNEIANLEKKLELYERFDEYFKSINPPAVLTSTQSQWLRSVKEDLSALLESYTGEADNLTAYLDQHIKGIENRNTAVYCAEEAIKRQSDLPEGYKPAEDLTLQGIIQNYCNRINDAINPENIKKDIDNIIAAYLKTANITANIGDGSNVDLSLYGYNANNWNDLQKELIIDTMMGWFGDTYDNDSELHDKYVGLFLDYLEESNKTFSQVNNEDKLWCVFEGSDPGKKLIAIRVVLNGGKDISWNIYEELIKTLGYEVATIIKDNDIYTEVYRDALYELIGKIESGEITDIDPSNIKGLVIDIILANLNEFQDDLTRKVPAEKVIDIYTDMYNDMDFSNGDLEELREKSIQCCDLLVKKGGKIGMAVIETFSTAYRSDIEKMDFSTLKSKMTSLNNKIIAIKNDIDEYTGQNKEDVNKYVPYSNDENSNAHTNCDFAWWGQWSNVVVGTNDTIDLTKWNIHNSESYKKGDLGQYPITYEYDVMSGLGSINDDKFIPGDEAGTARISVTAKVGDVYISHTYFDVKVVEGDTPATGEPEDTNGNNSPGENGGDMSIFDCGNYYGRSMITTLEDSEGAPVYIHSYIDDNITKKYRAGSTHSFYQDCVRGCIDQIYDYIIQQNDDITNEEKNNLSKVKDSLHSFYLVLLSNIENNLPEDTDECIYGQKAQTTVTYQLPDGSTGQTTTDYAVTVRGSDLESTVEASSGWYDSGISVGRKSTSGDDPFWYSIDTDKVFEKFKSLYNQYFC